VLERMGCTEGQGYLFAKPLPADEFVVWFASHRKTPSPRLRIATAVRSNCP